MVALLHPDSGAHGPVRPGRLRLVVDNELEPRPGRPERAGSEAGSSRRLHFAGVDLALDRQVLTLLAALVVLIFGGLLAVRVAQGSGAAEVVGQDGVQAVGAPVPGPAIAVSPGDVTIVAAPGDSLWSIARRVAPDSDPRPVVLALIEANGDDSIRIGQQIVIPEQLLD